MQPSNVVTMSPPANAPATAQARGNDAISIESLGAQLRAALPPFRVHSISLYDDSGNVLWLNEGALGPDEHALVIEAVETLGREISMPFHENGLEDGRVAFFLAVRAPQGALVGLVMILADRKSIAEGAGERMLTAHVRSLVQKIAVLLRPLSGRTTNTVKTLPAVQLEPETSAAHGTRAADSTAITPALSSHALEDILEFELTPDLAPAMAQTGTRRAVPRGETDATGIHPGILTVATARQRVLATQPPNIAVDSTSASALVPTLPDGVTIALEAQAFTKLRSGGRTRRYEVTATVANRDMQHTASVPDRVALHHLLSWLASHRSAWNTEPTSFTLNLSITTLEDERFPQFVATNLKAHGIAAESIGFEIAEALFLQRRAQMERFLGLCDRIGCFIVIDDFSLDSSIVSVLRSKALRLVKIDPKLTSVAMKDKVAQAMVVAIAQAVKVLGIHCAAKHVDSQATLQWLTAIGCDFAQGPAISRRQPLDRVAFGAAGTPAQRGG
ncbi:MAG TPA: EAL domain-containing protein [Steroidobacteraceae bacterium]